MLTQGGCWHRSVFARSQEQATPAASDLIRAITRAQELKFLCRPVFVRFRGDRMLPGHVTIELSVQALRA